MSKKKTNKIGEKHTESNKTPKKEGHVTPAVQTKPADKERIYFCLKSDFWPIPWRGEAFDVWDTKWGLKKVNLKTCWTRCKELTVCLLKAIFLIIIILCSFSDIFSHNSLDDACLACFKHYNIDSYIEF